MTDHNDFDRALAGWFEADALTPAPAGGLDRLLDATRRRRPRPAWLAGLGSRWVGEADHAQQSFLWRVTAAALLAVLTAGGVLYLLQPHQPAVGNPSEMPSPSTSIAVPTAAFWTATASLPTPHYGHTATLLPDGKVLVAGGLITKTGGPTNSGTPSAWLYDRSRGTWTATGNMVMPRSFATATLLLSGKVLVAGGSVSDSFVDTTSAELYDPSTGTWRATGNMVRPHSQATATLLANGQVLVAGGGTDTPSTATAELYNPDTGSWTATGNMTTPRMDHTATQLPDGEVLVVGGADFSVTDSNGFPEVAASAELYDPGTGSWAVAASMSTQRAGQTATILPDGKVLVTGGVGGGPGAIVAELYDPDARAWTRAGSTPLDSETATLLPDGTVLVAFGGRAAELYNSGTGSWTATASGSTEVGAGATATLLPDGTVLVVGGEGNGVDYASAELYHPAH